MHNAAEMTVTGRATFGVRERVAAAKKDNVGKRAVFGTGSEVAVSGCHREVPCRNRLREPATGQARGAESQGRNQHLRTLPSNGNLRRINLKFKHGGIRLAGLDEGSVVGKTRLEPKG